MTFNSKAIMHPEVLLLIFVLILLDSHFVFATRKNSGTLLPQLTKPQPIMYNKIEKN